ncbi:hypothetical protein [Psychroflexus torquis]|uniref:hypothetical protein n=1 Tax=Psychroflexus torquis TaxID=57029 RepID=UPI0000D53C9A|nr:hypothetical protein [Psychroflexus torquis]
MRFGSLTDENGKGKIELGSKLSKSGSISGYDVSKTGVAVLESGIGKKLIFVILEGDILIKKWFKQFCKIAY